MISGHTPPGIFEDSVVDTHSRHVGSGVAEAEQRLTFADKSNIFIYLRVQDVSISS